MVRRIKLILLIFCALAVLCFEANCAEMESNLTQPKLSLQNATKSQPWQNTLGMKFVPVNGTKVLFCIWETRVRDFEAFVNATDHDATQGMWSLKSDMFQPCGDTWKNPGFAQGSTHPVCGVSWNDAKNFCGWLTNKEQKEGLLETGYQYRLPTDAEWSVAVGLDNEGEGTPADKDSKINEVYP